MLNFIKCLGCRRLLNMTWMNQRKQFGRAMRAGLTREEAKALMPRCGKCTTKALAKLREAGTVPPVGRADVGIRKIEISSSTT